MEEFGSDDVEIYSAPGRSEIGGNHTDYQNGEILAASINLDAIGIVKKTTDNKVTILSKGYTLITISLDNLEMQEEEKETTIALIKGVLAGFLNHGYKIGGFKAYITSDVLIGAGLSSSAAYETLIGNILSGLYNDMSVSAEEIAIIGQFAENVYFGKPCGLMDQMACSVGNLVHVDFANPREPKVEKVAFDLNRYRYSLCITDTKGSHADLTADYASIPEEMKKVAAFFGKEVLLGLSIDDILDNISKLRELAGDRGVLRTIHFIRENERVQKEVSVFEKEDIDGVIHFAASSQVGESMKNPLKYYSNNLCGTEVLLESMVAHGIDKIVFSSTAATYGEPESIPILETDRTLPTNCYGETKLSMEKMFKWTSKAHNLRFVSLRYFNACGAHPNGKIGEAHNPETHLIPLILQVPNNQRAYISVFGNDYDTKDGTCVRDYIHVNDLAQAHILAMKYLRNGGKSDIFNLGNGVGFTVKEVIETARRVTGHAIPAKEEARRAGDPSTLIASSDKAKSILGWNPKYADLETIIDTAWRWHKGHPNGYQTV